MYALLGLILSLASLFFVRGAEDLWICSDGEWVKHGNPRAPKPSVPCRKEGVMNLSSPAFEQNGELPAAYTCDGEGINPPFAFSDLPPVTKSVAIIADDPDAPDGTYHHLVVWNIPADTAQIAGGMIPKSAKVGNNSAGVPGYAAACPPSGSHRYVFTAYALDSMLDLREGATRAEFDNAASGHIVAEATLTSRYSRRKR